MPNRVSPWPKYPVAQGKRQKVAKAGVKYGKIAALKSTLNDNPSGSE